MLSPVLTRYENCVFKASTLGKRMNGESSLIHQTLRQQTSQVLNASHDATDEEKDFFRQISNADSNNVSIAGQDGHFQSLYCDVIQKYLNKTDALRD